MPSTTNRDNDNTKDKKNQQADKTTVGSSIGPLALVGEYGPELVNLPANATVTPVKDKQIPDSEELIPDSEELIPDSEELIPDSEPKQIYYLKSDGKTKVDPNGKVIK